MTTPLQQAQADAAAVLTYLNSLTPPSPPPTPAPTTYTVTFNNVSPPMGQLHLAAGATFTVPPAPTPPANQVFADWGDGAHTYLPGWTYKMPAANVTLTAIYAPAPVIPTPAPTPTPSGSYPLGIAPPALAAGESVIFFDDFTTLNTKDWGIYNGTSQPSSGRFVTKNTTVSGGELHLAMNQDPVNGTQANNFEVGAGAQLITHTMNAGERVEFAFKNKPMAGAFQIGLLFAADNQWPNHGEIDILEQDDAGAFQSTVIWGDASGNRQQQQHPVPTVDGNAHMMSCAWTAGGHLLFCLDGTQYWDFPTPPLPFGAVGFNFCLQTQQEFVFNAPGQTSDEMVDWVRVVKLV